MLNRDFARQILPAVIAAVLTALIVAGGSNAALYQWSRTAASNATADPTINWAEGMSPSSVNDSARAMMARIADWRDDTSGATVTGGTGTVYTLASKQGFSTTALMNNQRIAFYAHATNGANATLNVDGLGAKVISSSSGVALPAGSLVAGTPYSVTYLDAGSGQFIVHGLYGNPYNVALGAYMFSSIGVVPNSNFVLAYGQCISRTTYAAYFALATTLYGACDGSTTFGVPDLRGRLVAGADDMGGSHANRMSTSSAGCNANFILSATCGNESQTLSALQLPRTTPSGLVSIADPGHLHGTGFAFQVTAAGGSFQSLTNAPGAVVSQVSATGITASFIGTQFGGDQAHPIVQPSMAGYVFVRIN